MYKPKKCRVCGQMFQPASSRQLDCNRPIIKECVICGKEFESKCSMNAVSRVCSAKCQNALALQSRESAYQQITRKCEICGQDFHPRNNTQRVCERRHYSKCVICGKEFPMIRKAYEGWDSTRKTCSDECRLKFAKLYNPMIVNRDVNLAKMKATMTERYGVEHPAQNPEILERQKQTSVARYGVEWFAQSDQYREVAEATNMEKYGVAWPIQDKDILAKRDATVIERYGVDNIMKLPEVVADMQAKYKEKTGYSCALVNPEVIEKTKQHNLDTYGVEYYSQTEEYKEKYKATSQLRYGTDSPMQNENIKQKAQQTCLDKYGATSFIGSKVGQEQSEERQKELYGVRRYSQTAEWKAAQINCEDVTKWVEFTQDPAKYIKEHYAEKPKYRTIAADLGVNPSTVSDFVVRNGLRDMISVSMSYMEDDIAHMLDLNNIKYEMHNRDIIYPLELDVYVPEFKLAIECDPTATHNSSQSDPWGSGPKSPSYHKLKTDKCEQAGVRLLHIFGYDWEYHRDVIESMILNAVNKLAKVIYARKCKLVNVTGADAMKFLNENHRQGAANSPINLGLEYEGELVSLMTFGKMRGTIGTGKEDLTDCYELVRFCSLLNTSVVGGASKLLKHFVNEYEPKRIRSFSDRAHTSGKLYQVLGFEEVRRSDPGYVWVNVYNDRAYHRVNAQKANIRKFLKDDSIDLSLTEREIMESHGFVRVYDSGIITWEWRKECCAHET